MRYIRRELKRQMLKAVRIVTPAIAAPMQRLRNAVAKKRRKQTAVNMLLVHQTPKLRSRIETVAPEVRALAWRDFLEQM